MTPLTITESRTPTATRLHITGELDHTTATELLDTASTHLNRTDLRELHLDFTNLTWCDSSGLSCLLLLHRRSTETHVRLHLLNRPPILDRILTLTGTHHHLLQHTPAQQPGRPESTG